MMKILMKKKKKMSDIQEKDYNLEKLIKENKIKRLRNKDSYMDAFLERRRQAANFALERKNASGCKYSKPKKKVK